MFNVNIIILIFHLFEFVLLKLDVYREQYFIKDLKTVLIGRTMRFIPIGHARLVPKMSTISCETKRISVRFNGRRKGRETLVCGRLRVESSS